MNKYLTLGILALILTGCTDSNVATKALKGAGYTDVKLTGYSWFACSKDDTYHTGFIAKGPTGIEVEGTVCSGLLFKNATIRSN